MTMGPLFDISRESSHWSVPSEESKVRPAPAATCTPLLVICSTWFVLAEIVMLPLTTSIPVAVVEIVRLAVPPDVGRILRIGEDRFAGV